MGAEHIRADLTLLFVVSDVAFSPCPSSRCCSPCCSFRCCAFHHAVARCVPVSDVALSSCHSSRCCCSLCCSMRCCAFILPFITLFSLCCSFRCCAFILPFITLFSLCFSFKCCAFTLSFITLLLVLWFQMLRFRRKAEYTTTSWSSHINVFEVKVTYKMVHRCLLLA